MKRTLLTPVILLALGACAADGTGFSGPTTAATVAPAAVSSQNVVATTPIVDTAPVVVAAPIVETTPIAAAPASTTTTATVPTNMGEIVLVEPVAPASQRGGNALLSIGSSIVGALIPGPWGSVAGVAAGQVGGIAMRSADTKSSRYHVRMADGTVQTVTQAGALSFAVGTPVQILTLADGSRTLIQTELATTPVAVATPI